MPKDLLTIELADVIPELKNKRLRGRLVGNKVVPLLVARRDRRPEPRRATGVAVG